MSIVFRKLFHTGCKLVLYCNHSHCFHDCKNKNCNKTHRRNIFNDNCVKFFHLKRSVYFHLIDNCLRFDNKTNKQTTYNRYNRHHYTVADKITEVKQTHSHRCDEIPDTKSQRYRNSYYTEENKNYCTGFLFFPIRDDLSQ